MTAPAYCPKCGAARAADARFCPSCGTPFEVPTTAPAPTSAAGSSSRRGESIVVGLIFVAVVVGGLLLLAQNSVNDTLSKVGAAITTPRPTPTPTERVELPIGGTGVVTFGLDYDKTTLEIIQPTERFKTTFPEIAWSASFTEPAGATSIKFVIASVTAGGGESVLISTDVDIADPKFDLLANKSNLASLVDNKAGTYVMRYLHEATVLAEGQFTLVR